MRTVQEHPETESDNSAAELEALIEEARRRARRRRLGYAGALVAAGVLVAGLVRLVGGGDGETRSAGPPTDPVGAVSQLARVTFDASALRVSIAVDGPGEVDYVARGLMNPSSGRFRLTVPRSRAVGLDAKRVVGLDGEGFESTVSELRQGDTLALLKANRCWLNPHLPVGSVKGSMSVEESTRLTGSVVESMRNEVRSATLSRSGFDVSLAPSAQRPRRDFNGSKRRVWGDRNLIPLIDGPIQAQETASGATKISYTLSGYRPPGGSKYRAILGGNPGLSGPIRITAVLEPSSRTLELNPPNCRPFE